MGCYSIVNLPWDENAGDEKRKPEVYITGASVRGPRHSKDGTPCQDAWASFPVHGGGWVLTVADGLSSAAHAEEGAADAVSISGETLASALSQKRDADRSDLIHEAVRTAREAIISRARSGGERPLAYASTLIILLFEDGQVTLGHIGDGIVAGVGEEGSIILSAPEAGEYANETACLVQDDWEDHLRISVFSHIRTCIIATDGCQGAIATRQDGVYLPHDPFIRPLISFTIQRMAAGIDPRADISGLLLSSRMENLSGDDKTLIILTTEDSGRL